MLINGVVNNLRFLIPIQSQCAQLKLQNSLLLEKHRRLTYNLQTYIHMYNYMYDELNKLENRDQLQTVEYSSQIERLRAYINLHLVMADMELNQGSPEEPLPQKKRK